MGFADFPFESRYVRVAGHRLHYIDEGSGPTLLFIHGNPTSSYLWRNVIKPLRQHYRCIALDLIGFGKSDKPDIDYDFSAHYRYLDGFVKALTLTDITLVGHDWGGVLAFQLAQRQPQRISGLCFMESFPFTFDWDEFPLAARPLFFAFRRPRLGPFLLMRQNLFLNVVLPLSVFRHLPHSVMAAYRAPFRQREQRRVILAWPNELPINDRQGATWQLVRKIEQALPEMRQPMLLLRFHPGAVLGETRIHWLKQQLPQLEITDCGRGLHYVQEDQPEAIADAIKLWRQRQTPATSLTHMSVTVVESDRYQGPLYWRWGHSPLGPVMAAWSDQGLVHLVPDTDPQQAREELAQRFPNAKLESQHSHQLDPLWRADSELALHLVGTAFQRRVWQQLLTIPAGETRSYSELARILDSQARAVGQAVGHNSIAFLVPCHRVIKRDGSLGGYRWGLALKKQLLANEPLTEGR
ncbi:MAG: haloalkane dehalogenase [Alcanivorax sp.]|nr:haloalkane dehalogenase [Alcanivorax sp.]